MKCKKCGWNIKDTIKIIGGVGTIYDPLIIGDNFICPNCKVKNEISEYFKNLAHVQPVQVEDIK